MMFLKNNTVTRQRGAEWRGWRTISMYMEVHLSILEYNNGVGIYVKGM
jgi:hypothetical protein